MVMTKQVINHINENYTDWELSGWACWRIAGETGAAISTVYRAIKSLREMGAMDGKKFVRRQFLKPEEYIPFADCVGLLLLTDNKVERIVHDCVATKAAVFNSLRWAELSGVLERRNGGCYGLMYQVKEPQPQESR